MPGIATFERSATKRLAWRSRTGRDKARRSIQALVAIILVGLLSGEAAADGRSRMFQQRFECVWEDLLTVLASRGERNVAAERTKGSIRTDVRKVDAKEVEEIAVLDVPGTFRLVEARYWLDIGVAPRQGGTEVNVRAVITAFGTDERPTDRPPVWPLRSKGKLEEEILSAVADAITRC